MRREREGKERIGEGKRDSGGGTYRKFNRKLCVQSCACVCISPYFASLWFIFGSHTDTHSLLVSSLLTYHQHQVNRQLTHFIKITLAVFPNTSNCTVHVHAYYYFFFNFIIATPAARVSSSLQ